MICAFAARIKRNKGVAMLKTIFILMIMLIIISFLFQAFSIFKIANNIKEVMEKSVMTLCALNMPTIYDSLREGHTAIADEAGNLLYNIVTEDDIVNSLSESLPVSLENGRSLVMRDSNGAPMYSIHNLQVAAQNIRSIGTQEKLTFVILFDLEVYVAAYWNFGSITVPMKVVSGYSCKF